GLLSSKKTPDPFVFPQGKTKGKTKDKRQNKRVGSLFGLLSSKKTPDPFVFPPHCVGRPWLAGKTKGSKGKTKGREWVGRL
ncbi:MAG TPA: hypothetical protein VG013_14700, partial [Gemmataceae bacterium]|nr:hypothetical protein [Gemmataceae bacterium]